MFDLSANYQISRSLASQGMVLLKNEDTVLPFKAEDHIGIIGKECLDIIKGGGGSAKVMCEYVKSLVDGLNEKHEQGKFVFYEPFITLAQNTDVYSIPLLNQIAEKVNKAIVTFQRYGTEGDDRPITEFYPTETELELLDRIDKSNMEHVVLILNVCGVTDLSFIQSFKKIKSVLLTYLPGMECGTAIADVLSGDVNPSGKLIDTIAYDYTDYPTSDYFDYDKYETRYNEGIFVGYRYFETFAKDKVLYPFGFGLSYTEFTYSDYAFTVDRDIMTVSVNITNSGTIAGREVVQAYVSAPTGNLPKPSIELKGYTKTKVLEPAETETIHISFPIKELASYDTDGVTGYSAAWVLENGDYSIYVGKSIREIYSCGIYHVAQTIVTEQLANRFGGDKYSYCSELFTNDHYEVDKIVTLYDVQQGKADIKDLINQLNVEELISLSQGQPLGFPMGTSGVGNLKKYGIPNAQTADGPAGIRRSVNTTCFPCATLIACSWDKDLQYAMGAAMGYEGYSTGIDILLAPAMNIHRDPLCGRSFEYFSEDPLITGKTAAALVNGMQSQGLCATIKHFAANNCEYFRNVNNSIVEERALREIYLKGFEIAVKESNPAYIMTSYNLLNGEHTSANSQLLRGILRDEWKYEGATMTDWRNGVPLVDEIIAGNNIKMPFGYPDEAEKALHAHQSGIIPLCMLRENAYYVVKSIMKTRAFEKHDFGIIHKMRNDKLVIPAMEVNGLASSRISHSCREDGVPYLWHLNREQRNQRSFVYYVIDVETPGNYSVAAEISTNCPETQIWFYNENNERSGTAYCDMAIDENKWYVTKTTVPLQKGENVLKLVFANEPYKDYDYFNPGPEIPNAWPEVAKEDIRLTKLTLKLQFAT